MDGQAGKELQCSHISAELGLLTVGLMRFFSLCHGTDGAEKRGGRGDRGRLKKRDLLLKFEAQSRSPSWTT